MPDFDKLKRPFVPAAEAPELEQDKRLREAQGLFKGSIGVLDVLFKQNASSIVEQHFRNSIAVGNRAIEGSHGGHSQTQLDPSDMCCLKVCEKFKGGREVHLGYFE